MDLGYAFENVLAFIEQGGDVQWVIVATTALMWSLILERAFYVAFRYRRERKQVTSQWFARSDRSSWYAQQIRKLMINQTCTRLRGGIPLAKTLVAVCPMLGLLGTVVGMIEVFDVMKLSGNSNPRALASGVSQATITTMAGMVAALSGLFVTLQLDRYAANEQRRLEDVLSSD